LLQAAEVIQMPHFDPEFFAFLVDLEDNNDRDWFQANKERYRRSVQEPLLRFIEAFGEPLRAISPRFVADPRPSGGSMFRIYRDVRFSKDKSPYKTHAAAQFRHQEGRDVHAPGFYLHLEPDNVFVGAGIWHPAGPTLAAVRDAIVERSDDWSSAISGREFTAAHSLGGESLKRPPRGYDPDHPQIEHLKRKDFVAFRSFSQKQACRADFIERVADSYRASSPFVRFLAEAVGLPFD
jgi:uncharacterized protein (TIGR02453 family)